MLNLKYKLDCSEMNVSFNDRRDLILFVAANHIKDEDLVSIDFGEGEISGGIEGLTTYVIDKINKQKEEEKLAVSKSNKDNEEDCYHLSDFEFEDKYYFVEQVTAVDEGCVRLHLDTGESFIADTDKRMYIIKNGDEYGLDDLDNGLLDDAAIIRVRAKYIHEGDILVNM